MLRMIKNTVEFTLMAVFVFLLMLIAIAGVLSVLNRIGIA